VPAGRVAEVVDAMRTALGKVLSVIRA